MSSGEVRAIHGGFNAASDSPGCVCMQNLPAETHVILVEPFKLTISAYSPISRIWIVLSIDTLSLKNDVLYQAVRGTRRGGSFKNRTWLYEPVCL